MNNLGSAYLLRTALLLAAVVLLIAAEQRTPRPDLAATPGGDGADFVRCRAD